MCYHSKRQISKSVRLFSICLLTQLVKTFKINKSKYTSAPFIVNSINLSTPTTACAKESRHTYTTARRPSPPPPRRPAFTLTALSTGQALFTLPKRAIFHIIIIIFTFVSFSYSFAQIQDRSLIRNDINLRNVFFIYTSATEKCTFC